MKIAYLVHWPDVSRESGVLKKVVEQTRTWRTLGEDARLFLLTSSTTLWEGMHDVPVDVVQRGTPLLRAARMHILVQCIRDWHPDIVYFRISTWYPALDTLMESFPTVLEINGFDPIQNRQTRSFPAQLYYGITRRRILRRAAGVVTVAYQLAVVGETCGIPTAVVPNSIDLSAFSPLPAPANEHPRFVMIGNAGVPGTNKHGWEKVLWLAQQRPQWHFDLVGVRPVELPAPLPPNVVAHGWLSRAQYEQLLAQADVAFGSLAMHRAFISENSSLKVLEYLAFGLPVIISYTETCCLEPVPYILQLPNREENVQTHLPEIERFVARWRGQRVARADVLHLDARVRERERLGFLGTMCQQ